MVVDSHLSPGGASPLSDSLSDDEVDRLFRALADATRRDIVRRTLVGEASVSGLAADYDMSFAAVQKHVAVLEQAGLVTKEARGRERIVRGNPIQIAKARELLVRLEELWRARFSQLDDVLADEAAASPSSSSPSSSSPSSSSPSSSSPSSSSPSSSSPSSSSPSSSSPSSSTPDRP